MKYDEAPKTHPLKIDYEIETKELDILHILNTSITYEIYPKIYRWNLWNPTRPLQRILEISQKFYINFSTFGAILVYLVGVTQED